jgi:hypothetical protein
MCKNNIYVETGDYPRMGGDIIPTILTVEEPSKIALPPACTAGIYIIYIYSKEGCESPYRFRRTTTYKLIF